MTNSVCYGGFQGWFTTGDVLNAMREGAFTYFAGPFERQALVQMVREAMDSPCWDDGIEVLSGTPDWVSLAARCDIETAHRSVQFLRSARDPRFPEAARESVAFAFREILLNAMEYGGHFDPSHYVKISFIRGSHAIALRIKDPGQDFSFEELRHAAVAVRPAISLVTLPFAKSKAYGQVASGC